MGLRHLAGLVAIGAAYFALEAPSSVGTPPECNDRTVITSPCVCGDREVTTGFCCGGVSRSGDCAPFDIYGFGSATIGGSLGQPIVVNTLDGGRNALGPGFACPGANCSIREAIARPNRLVTFGVSGTIVLEDDLVFEKPNVTLDGSTAPNGGIQIRSDVTRIRADEIIVRHLRFRHGNVMAAGDGLTIEQGRNIVLDHVSCQWGSDECISVVGFEGRHVENVTIQNSLIAEVFDSAIGQGKQRHSYGTAVGGDTTNISFYRNLYALNRNRNPQLGGGSQGPEKLYEGTSTFEVVENVVYGFDVGSFVAASSPRWRTNADFIRNVYITGPRVNPNPQVPIQILVSREEGPLGTRYGPVSVFLQGNIAWSRSSDEEPECKVFLDRRSSRRLRDACHNANKSMFGVRFVSNTRHSGNYFPAGARGTIEESVLRGAGATLSCRDSVDRRIVGHVRSRTGTLVKSDPAEVGGYPDLTISCTPTGRPAEPTIVQ